MNFWKTKKKSPVILSRLIDLESNTRAEFHHTRQDITVFFIFILPNSSTLQANSENPVSMKKTVTNGLFQPFGAGHSPPATIILLAILFVSGPTGLLFAQPEGQARESIFSHLAREGEAIQLTLQTDLDELVNNRLRKDYQPAELSYRSREGKEVRMEVNVIPRGNYRRKICDFPPIMLNFSKSLLAERGMESEYDKIKLVTHCKKGGEAQGYLLKEYLAYKIYNLLSSNSYRVQLAQITYKDSKGAYKDIEQFGILIEDTDEMAHRIGGLECECWNFQADSVVLAYENTMSVFQYMIGNEDWSIPLLRNIKLIRPYDGGKIIPVPYDFDFSGFVNAPYAVPRSQLGISNIKQRIFLGFPVEEELLSETMKKFESQREQIESMIKNAKRLGAQERKDAIKYVKSFYQKKQLKRLAEEVAEKRMEQEASATND